MSRCVLGAVVVGVWIGAHATSAQVVRQAARFPPREDAAGTAPRGESTADDGSRSDTQRNRHAHGTDRPRPHGQAPSAARPGGDLFLAGPQTYAPDARHAVPPSRRPLSFSPGYGYVGDPYLPTPPMPVTRPSPEQPTTAAAGSLLLQVQPATAQVRVDGFYAGTGADFDRSGTGRALEAGPHRVEIRADGFETVTVDVRIFADETTTYRRDLARIDQRPRPPALAEPRAPHTTLFLIDRCYAGDTPPVAALLPAGCDAARVRTIAPLTR